MHRLEFTYILRQNFSGRVIELWNVDIAMDAHLVP